MNNYYEVKPEYLFIRASSKKEAIKIFKNKFSKDKRVDMGEAYVDTIYSEAEMYNIQHMGHPNWPNCDIGGCGDITADIG